MKGNIKRTLHLIMALVIVLSGMPSATLSYAENASKPLEAVEIEENTKAEESEDEQTENVEKKTEKAEAETEKKDKKAESEKTEDNEEKNVKSEDKEKEDKKKTTPQTDKKKETKANNGESVELSTAVDDVDITLKAEAGAFPADISLSVEKISHSEQKKVDKAVNKERSDNANVAHSYTFDIKVNDADGNEVQPAEGHSVDLSFTMDRIANEAFGTHVYHVAEDDKGLNATELPVTKDRDTATVTTDGFSYYTVEFTYGDKQYVLDGDGIVKLSDILTSIGITGNIESYEVSNDELFNIYMGNDEDIGWDYDTEERGIPGDLKGGTVPYMVSLRPFQTEEWLDVTVDGIKYRVIVTDDINIGGTNVGDIDGIEQGNVLGDFTANMPIATIWIDEDIINMEREARDQGGYAKGGLTEYAKNTYGDIFLDKVTNKPGDKVLGDNFVAVNLSKIDLGAGVAKPTDVSPDNHLEFNGDIAQYKYEGAARDKDGNLLDVYITYSNLKINFQNNISQTNWDNLKNNAAITLWSGNMADINGMQLNADKDGTTLDRYGLYDNQQRVGAVWDTHIQVKNSAGEAVEGTFYFPMVDIDVPRTGGWENVNNAGTYNNFSEQVLLHESSVDPSSAVYIPGADTTRETYYYTDIERIYGQDGGWLFKPRTDAPTGSSTYDRTFYTGFMTLVNNSNGIHMQNQFGGTGNATVETYFMVAPSKVSYQLKPTSITYDSEGKPIGCKNTTLPEVSGEGITGGRIQTTQHGNKSGLLADGSGVIDEVTIATVAGQTVNYTLTPLPGYRLKGDVIVKRGDLNYVGGTPVTPQVVTDSAGNPRYYTFAIKDIGENNAIHVEWEPTKLKLTKKVERNGAEAEDTFRFRIKVTNPNAADAEMEIYSVKAFKDFEDTSSHHREYYDFENPDPNHPTVDTTGYTVDDLGNHIYLLSARSGTAAPDLSALTGDGWVVLESKKEKFTFDLDKAMADADSEFTKVQGTTDTYEIGLKVFKNENYIKSDIFNGIVPVGWSYEITEVGENGPPEQIGTQPGWELVDKSINAKEPAFDGDEEVEFTNRRAKHSIRVKKKTVDNKAGTFTYRIKAWKDGEPETYVDFSNLSYVTDKGNGYYEFKLTVPASATDPAERLFENIPRDYKYEVQELVEDRWEVVSIQRDTDETYRVQGGKKYKVIVEDLDPKDNVTEEKDINLIYKRVKNEISGDETKEIYAVGAEDSTLLTQFFDVQDSTFESGKKKVDPSKVNADEITTGTRTAVSATLTDKNGKTYQSGNVPADKTSFIENSIEIADLTTITPTIEVNGHTVKYHGGQWTQDHFQTQTDGDTVGRTYMRLRTGNYGMTSSYTASNRTVSYNDTIVYTYPNAATLPNGTKKDVIITLSDVSITIPDTASSMSQNFKGAIFDSTAGSVPQVAAYIIGTATPSSYTVNENVQVKIDGAEAGQKYKVTFDGTGYPGDGSTPVTFSAKISGNKRSPATKPINIENGILRNITTVESDPFKITVGTQVTNPNITPVSGEADTYIVDLSDDQVLTIPGGRKYKVYEIIENPGGEPTYNLVKDSAWTSEYVTGPSTYTSKLDQGDVIITYTNEYTIKLTAKKIVKGNLGSRDKYFMHTFAITGATPYTVLTLDMTDATTAFEPGATMNVAPNAATIYSRNMILTGTDDGTGNNGNERDDDNEDLTFGASGVTEIQKKALAWMSGDYNYKWDETKGKYIKKHKTQGDENEVDTVPANATHSKSKGQQIICDRSGAATVEVYLQHNQKTALKGISYGAGYFLSEINEDYKPNTDITEHGDMMTDEAYNSTTSSYENGTDIILGDGNSSVSDSHLLRTTEVTFTNRKSAAVPTEVRVPMVLGGLLLILASIEWLILRLRKRRREAYYEE